MEKKIKITFHSGTESPTGSNFFYTTETGSPKVLIDCGLIQGCKICEDDNRDPFPYDPSEMQYLLVTHAHIDHVGRIPKLVRDGFRGKILSTTPTKDIGELMLMDSMGVLGKEARRDKLPPIYEEKDVQDAMTLWEGVSYGSEVDLGGGVACTFLDAGHILGSAMVRLTYNGKHTVFSGDLGNTPAPLLPSTESIKGTHVLVMESVYGDRNHEPREERRHALEDVIEEAVKKGGALMIPAFSLERTQVLLAEINELVENGRIPEVPIFIDSPLAIDVTKIYKKYESYFNDKAKDIIKSGDDIFHFKGLQFTYKTEESKAIADVPNPKIIIAGSGMSNGGRIIHHEKRHLPDPNSTLLIIGYQVPGSLGRKLQDGEKNVKILGDEVPARARIATIHGYSAHKDSDNLVSYVHGAGDTLSEVFCVLGEPKASGHLAQRIRDHLGIRARVPRRGETIEIPV